MNLQMRITSENGFFSDTVNVKIMTAYRNFTIDFPKRIADLDNQFHGIAKQARLDVSYTLMKLAAAFLLPYERIEGTSGSRSSDIANAQRIRKHLDLDRRFEESSYCNNISSWKSLDVDGFNRGPSSWFGLESSLSSPVHKVLAIIRHSVAHSNIYFAGENEIEHIYLGNRKDILPNTNKYRVVRCTVYELEHLINVWISNLQKLRASPFLIWHELEVAV